MLEAPLIQCGHNVSLLYDWKTATFFTVNKAFDRTILEQETVGCNCHIIWDILSECGVADDGKNHQQTCG